MAKSRAANEGSVYKRKDGRWVAQVTTYDGGKRRLRAIYARTQGDALAHLKAARKSADAGMPLPGVRLTVGTYLDEWLKSRAQLRPESMRRYRDSVNLHLTPELGRIALSKLTPMQVEGAYARLAARGLSGTTVQLAHGVLRKALGDAVKRGLVQRNVASHDLIDAPKRSTGEMRTLTLDEAARLLAAAEGDALEAFYVLALTTGMRLGELQALRWSSVDIERRRVRVVATLTGIVDGEPVLGEPKTDKSKRTIHLSARAAEALRSHRTRQVEQRLAAGAVWRDRGFVFSTGTGHPLDGNNVRVRSFAPLLARAGLPAMRFHDLRHTAATLLMAEGVPIKAASEMLGHSDITTTLRVYSHVLEPMHQQAADAMDRLFGGRRVAE